MDKDLQVYDDATAAVGTIDRRYRKANFKDKLELKPSRDKAFKAYAKARLKLLEDGTLATAADVKKMDEIRLEIGRARKTQTVVEGALRLAEFLVKFA